jgi:uncharacterized protein (DUF849 family)
MSPYLPITPDEIASKAIAAAEAGAAILHLHARDPENDQPDQTPEAFARFLPRIKQGTAAINITTGGGLHEGRGTGEAGRGVQDGSRVAQHGLDEFRPLSPGRQIRDLQVRLGEASPRGHTVLARKIIEGLAMEVATPDEAGAILELKGGDKVAF